MLAARSATSERASVICAPSRLRAGRSVAAEPAAPEEPSTARAYRSGSQAAPAYAVARRNSRRFMCPPFIRSVFAVFLRAAARALDRIAPRIHFHLFVRRGDEVDAEL